MRESFILQFKRVIDQMLNEHCWFIGYRVQYVLPCYREFHSNSSQFSGHQCWSVLHEMTACSNIVNPLYLHFFSNNEFIKPHNLGFMCSTKKMKRCMVDPINWQNIFSNVVHMECWVLFIYFFYVFVVSRGNLRVPVSCHAYCIHWGKMVTNDMSFVLDAYQFKQVGTLSNSVAHRYIIICVRCFPTSANRLLSCKCGIYCDSTLICIVYSYSTCAINYINYFRNIFYFGDRIHYKLHWYQYCFVILKIKSVNIVLSTVDLKYLECF